MNFQKITFPEEKIFLLAKTIKDFTKVKGIVLRRDRKNRILVYFPKNLPRLRIEELKVILKTKFPEETFLFREYRKTIF